MDYEQKYKEALGWMRSLYKGLHGATKEDAEHYFPELKENENERIRKEIVDFITSSNKYGTNERCEAWLTWLKKQGGNPYSGVSFEYNGNTWGMCARDSGVEILFDGELKAFLSLEKSFIYPIYPKPNLAHKSAIEAIKENVGNNNKVEPKFHVGDWISCYYTNYKVLSVNNNGYLVEDTDGNKINILFENEKFHHLFTIADAKDGDVLAAKDGRPFIFTGEFDAQDDNPIAYCGINSNDTFITGKGSHWTFKNGIKPATNEQRELLFQKMKEAGYEWDAEKKELKKIEHKMLNADEVIAWLEDQACLGWIEDVEVHIFVDKFKQDFKL